MEFLTTKQKKQKARRLFVAYGLLSLLIVLATYVLISTALGFDIFKGKDVVQNGLLFVDSRPDNADVYLNGKKEADASNAKYSVPESTYDVRLVKSGYRDWNGTVQVIGGEVKFLTYPRLLPEAPAVLTQQTHPGTPTFTQSRDKQWLASTNAEVPDQITIYNLANPTDLVRTLTIPAVISGAKKVTGSSVLEWAGDNDHFLVRVQLSETAEPKYVLLHKEKPEEFTDVSGLFPIVSGDSIGLWNGRKDLIYVQRADGSVFLGNTKDKSLSAQTVVSEKVVVFTPISDERVLYTTVIGDQLFVKLYVKGKTYVITTTTNKNNTVLMKTFGFNRNDYIAVGGDAFDKTYLYRNFEKAAEASTDGRIAPFFTIPQKSSTLDASRSNRFVLASDSTNAAVYDIEQREIYRYELPVARPAELGWFDDVRLYAIDSDKKLSVMDFDGQNKYEIGVSALGVPYVDRDVAVAAFQSNITGVVTTNFIDIESASQGN